MYWKSWKELRHLPRSFWMLFSAILLNRAGTMVVPFLAVYLNQSLGFSIAQAGLVVGFYGLGALIAGPLSGQWVDHYGARSVMLGSLLSSSISCLLILTSRSFLGISLLCALFAFCNESFRPASLAWVTEQIPASLRKVAFAATRLSINLGMSVGPLLGGLLASVSFQGIFWVDGLTAAAAAFFLWAFLPASTSHAGQSAKKSLFLSFRDPAFLGVMIGIFPVLMIFFQHESTMPLFLVKERGWSEASYGLLFTLNTVLILLFEIPLNAAMSNWSFRKSLVLGSLLYGVGFGALSWGTGTLFIAVTVAIWTVGEMVLMPSLSAYVSEIAPARSVGAYMGAYTSVFSLSLITGPILGSWVYENLGSNWLWGGCLLAGGLSMASIAYLNKKYLK